MLGKKADEHFTLIFVWQKKEMEKQENFHLHAHNIERIKLSILATKK